MKQGVSLPTRGMMEDIGRGVSHKTKAVELYLKNYTLSEIARKKISKLSERLTKEYISLIERAESEGYKDRLNQLLDPFKVNEPLKNAGGGGSAMTDKGLVKREYAKKYTDRFKGEHCEMCS